jgi:hypothetical protein
MKSHVISLLSVVVNLFAGAFAPSVIAATYELTTPNFNHVFYAGLSTTSDRITVRFTTPTVNWFRGPGYYSPTLVSSVPITEYVFTPQDNMLRMSSGGMNFVTVNNNNGHAAYIGSVDQFGIPLQYAFSLRRSYQFPQFPGYSEPVTLDVSYNVNTGGFAKAQSDSGYYGAYIQTIPASPWPSFRLLTFYNGNFIDGMTGWDLGGLSSPTSASYLGKTAVKFGNPSNSAGTLSQILHTTPGEYYQLSYSLASTGGTDFFCKVGGVTLFDDSDLTLSAAYTTITDTFLATSATTELLFSGTAVGSFYLADISLTKADAPAGYAGWISGYSDLTGPDALAAADPDEDASDNLTEYAFGTDPTTPSSGVITHAAGVVTGRGQATISLTNIPDAGDFLAVFGRRKDYLAAGLTYTVQFSADLGTWEDSTATPAVLASDAAIDAMSVPCPMAINNLKPRFFRLMIRIP